MKKKTLCILLSGAMTTGILTGCSNISLPFGNKVTAESLLENAFGEEKAEAIDLNIEMNMSAEMDTSELGVDLGTDGSMELEISLDAGLQSNKSYGHMDGDAVIKMFGMKMDEAVEAYYDYDEGIQYEYVPDSNSWVYTDLDSDSFAIDSFTSDWTKMFDDAVLKDHKKGEDYVVTATLDYDDFKEMTDADMTGILEGAEDTLEDLVFDIEMSFDEKSKIIKTMNFDIDLGDAVEELTINDFYMNFTFNQIGGDIDVSIPKKVIKNAESKTDAAEIDTEFLYDGSDSDLSYNDDDNTGSISDADITTNPVETQEGPETQEVPVQNPGPDRQETPAATTETGNLGYFGKTKFVGGMPISELTSAGWVFDDTFDGIFLPAENSRYEDAELYAYGKKNPIHMSDLEQDGVWGYSISVEYIDGNDFPEYSIGGLTWGATSDDIKAVFGEPEDDYMSDTTDRYIMYYTLEDGTEVTFVTTEKANMYNHTGLVEVSVVNYDIIN